MQETVLLKPKRPEEKADKSIQIYRVSVPMPNYRHALQEAARVSGYELKLPVGEIEEKNSEKILKGLITDLRKLYGGATAVEMAYRASVAYKANTGAPKSEIEKLKKSRGEWLKKTFSKTGQLYKGVEVKKGDYNHAFAEACRVVRLNVEKVIGSNNLEGRLKNLQEILRVEGKSQKIKEESISRILEEVAVQAYNKGHEIGIKIPGKGDWRRTNGMRYAVLAVSAFHKSLNDYNPDLSFKEAMKFLKGRGIMR